jgi:aldose 1-epimerase
MDHPRLITLEDGPLRVVVDSEHGARIRSISLDGAELLRSADDANSSEPLNHGAYPMAPFAGRIAEGCLEFGDDTHQLERNLGNHAGHGVVYDRPWSYNGEEAGIHAWTITADERWPFPCFVTQSISLSDMMMRLSLKVESTQESPAWAGWHPWWRRDVGRGEPLVLDLPARTMLERDGHLPTGERVPVSEGPWDDAFTDLDGPITLSWPGFARIEMTSDHPWWVVFTEQPDAIAVEPQSAPPNALALGLAATIGPGLPLVVSTVWQFSL